MWLLPGHHRWRAIAALVLLAGTSACAAKGSIEWHQPPIVNDLPSAGPVFVMAPFLRGNATGNVGRDFRITEDEVAARILAIVRERFPGAERAEVGPRAARPGVPRWYAAATGEAVVTPEEVDAANRALQRGATHLLVPIITEWREMRTDDPVGGFIGPHDSVTVTLRLMRLQPPELVGRVTFTNHARLTLNQGAAGLLDERFRRVVLQLVSGPAASATGPTVRSSGAGSPCKMRPCV